MKIWNRIISFVLALAMVLSMVPYTAPYAHAEESAHQEQTQEPNAETGDNHTHTYENGICTICGAEAPLLAGKTISILGASISTYAGTSNGAAADTTNSTIRDNAKYYPNATVNDVTLNDTWWMQAAEDLGLRLLVNNSWSGSSLLYERNGTEGAYVDRCVQLHDDTGDNAGEMPDIIGIQMGTNDFQYYKDTLGTADIDYAALITANGDGTYTYATPVTSLEAAAIVLHKISVRYPDAEVYYLNISQRVDGTDELIRSFNAELKQVVEHFGAHIVDIYGSAITMENFDTYIGDGRVHPNCLGMDAYTEAFKRALTEHTAYRMETHTVSLELDGVTADYGDDKIVVAGDRFTVNLSAADSLQVTVTMGGEDITASTYANGTVTIDAVTADVTVTARSVYTPKNYRWEFDGTDLVCVLGGNDLTKNSGTTTDGVFSNTRYALENAVRLLHDQPWVVEWKSEGTFQNTGGSSGARIFTSTDVNAEYNARYIFKSNTKGLIAMGEKTTTGSHNYGLALADYGIDWTQLHTYRLENRIAEDGSNMIWLFVDGVEVGPLNRYYVGTKDQNTTSDWLSGKDFLFPYMGTDTHGFTNAAIDYIAVWEVACEHTYNSVVTAPTCTEQGYTTHTCTTCGHSYADTYTGALGHSYQNRVCAVCGETQEVTALTWDQAVDELRKQLTARNNPITLTISSGLALTTDDMAQIFREAMAHTGNPKEGDYIRRNQLGRTYEISSQYVDGVFHNTCTFTVNWLSTPEQEAEVDAAVDALLAELDLWDATEYEKIKGTYDWITENVSYDYDNYDDTTYLLKHSTYAALIQRVAVCQGYASLYYRLLLELGVDCRYISGTSDNENHGWNIVCLEGKYYNCDPTWDRSLMGHYRNFLCTEANFGDHLRDAEFSSEEFYAQYPMAVAPYVFNVAASGKIREGLEWVLDGDTGILTVAGTGAIPSYRYSDAPWYPYRESVQGIVVTEGITEVGERAFYWCTNCTSVSLPESLIAIREYGFNNLRALQSITLPSNLKILEFCAFSECAGLQSITLPDSVTTVGSSVFSNCPNLFSATLSAGMTTIPSSMFFNDGKLMYVTIPEGITYIDDTAFHSTNLWKVHLPASLTGLGSSVFAGCKGLKEFTVAEGNTAYKAVNGVLFTANGKTLICYPAGKSGSYTVPEGTEYIATSAFRSCNYLYGITFCSTLKEIGDYSFSYCQNLTSITLPKNVTRVCDSAFRSCTSLRYVTFQNDSVILESGGVFAECDSLTSITLPAKLTEIPGYLFYGCALLDNVVIPSTATKIGSSAFLDCDNLTSITIPGNVKSIGRQAFDFCNRLQTIEIQEGCTTIEDYCIRNCPALTKVVIPSSVTSIGKEMFDECPKVVLYVNCGTYGYRYAVNNGRNKSVSHPYTVSRVVEPTCTAQGYTVMSCKCGTYSYNTNYVSAYGHDYIWEVTDPTCTTEGYTTYICTRCGDWFEDDWVAALGHDTVLLNYVAETCTTDGYSGDEYCETCGQTVTTGQTIPATGHIYDGWTVTKPVSCTENGSERHDCQNCDHYETRTVEATGHDYKSVVTEPTCTEQGYTAHTCSVCGDSYVDSYVDATGHKYGDWTVTDAATCTEDGEERRDCTNCDHYETRTIEATGHDYKAVVTAPTCTEQGYTTHTCTVCGDSYVDSYVNATGHDYKSVVTGPTCTEQGYTTHTCTVCGHSYIDSYVNANGHRYTVVNTLPMGTAKGNSVYICSVCSDQYQTAWLDPSAYEGMTIACIGDSITAGVGVTINENDYVTVLVQQLGMEYIRLGASGTTLCTGGHRTCNISKLTESNLAGADVVTILMGINDWDQARAGYYALGDINSTDTSTIYGAVKMWCERIQELRKTEGLKNTQFYFVTPVITSWNNSVSSSKDWDQSKTNIHGYTLRDLCNAIIEVCALYDIPVIDLNLISGMYYNSPEDNNVSDIGGDGVHPGATGHAMMAEALAHALLQNELRDDHEHQWGSWITTRYPCCLEGTESRVCTVCTAVQCRILAATGEHWYIDAVTEPTCTEQGYTTHTCTKCRHSYVDSYVNATGHSYGNWTVVKAATCTEAGEERRDCTNCDHYETRTIEATGHDYKAVVTEPTCTEQGYTTHTCTVCGDSYVDSYVDATGHKFGSWFVVDDATCTKDGAERRDCANCDHYETRAIKATGHDYKTVVTEPTCTEQGYTTHTCTVCGDSYVDSYVDATGHKFGSWFVVDDATCTKDGAERRDCANCDHYETRAIKATGHDYKAVVTEPTCTEQGYTTHTCATCGHSYKDSYVDATGHKFGDWTVTKAASCTEEGTERRDCRNCDYYETRTVEATGHDYKAVVTDPTCTEQGYTTHTCTVCGDSYVDSYVNATGHKFGNWTVTKKATCTEDGEERRDCTDCDHYETRTVEATGHDYKAVVTEPTCTEQGYTTHTCSVCGDSYKDSYVDATGHKYGDWTVTKAATCTEEGQERRDCANCDHYETRTIEATGHDYKSVVTAPTCTERGYTTHTCTVCSDNYVDSYVNATGHKYGDWTVTKAAACTEEGTERRDCQNCDHYETRTIEATGHDYKAVVTEPTCTEQGYTTYTCGTCGHSYKDSYVDPTGHKFSVWCVVSDETCTKDGQERRDCANCDHYEIRTIEATGHDYKAVITEPTCTEQGYTTHTCSECGDSYVDSYVDATGHKYGPWEITVEPETGKKGERQRSCEICGHTETEEVPALDFQYGDCNGDGKVNGKDLILLRQYLADWDVEPDLAAADCNGDGKVNGKDLILLRQYLADWDVTLGPQE